MSASFISQGAGPTIVFLHGVGSGKEGFSNQIDPVVSNGWHFLSIDAPGASQSDAVGSQTAALFEVCLQARPFRFSL